MGYRVIIQREAAEEIKQAYEWYEERKANLGIELLEEIDHCLNKISENPEQYGFVRKNYFFRRIQLKRFPYKIVFEFDQLQIFIISFSHNNQNRDFDQSIL